LAMPCGEKVFCDEAEFCDFAPGVCSNDRAAKCTQAPGGCSEPLPLVCGCDHKTYLSDCERRLAAASKLMDGPCEVGCGQQGDPCPTGSECCPFFNCRGGKCAF